MSLRKLLISTGQDLLLHELLARDALPVELSRVELHNCVGTCVRLNRVALRLVHLAGDGDVVGARCWLMPWASLGLRFLSEERVWL